MENLTQTIESEMLALSPEDRTRLAIRLLSSIETRPNANPKQVEKAWLEETHQRYEAYLRGENPALLAEDVFSKLRTEDI
jgi:putative addiction module component (TIGR02574 family)